MCVAHDNYMCHLHIVGCSLRIQPISFSKKGKKKKEEKEKRKKKEEDPTKFGATLCSCDY